MTSASSIGHQNQCAHPDCLCQAEPGERYCSDFCRGTQEPGRKVSAPAARGDICGCGHSACAHLGSRE